MFQNNLHQIKYMQPLRYIYGVTRKLEFPKYPPGMYLFKVYNEKSRAMGKNFSKVIIISHKKDFVIDVVLLSL